MKKIITASLFSLAAAGFIVSCQKEENKLQQTGTQEAFNISASARVGQATKSLILPGATTATSVTCDYPYSIEITSVQPITVNGQTRYQYTWTVVNTNPGNGSNNTVQDLSNWGFILNNCCPNATPNTPCQGYNGSTGATPANIKSTSPNTTISLTNNFGNCGFQTNNMYTVKFDYGTSGATPQTYTLTLDKEYTIEDGFAYYKSGSKMPNGGCGTVCADVLGCEVTSGTPAQ